MEHTQTQKPSLLTSLGSLNYDELDELRQQATRLMGLMNGSTPAPPSELSTDKNFAREVLDVLVQVLSAVGAEERHRAVLERSNLYGRFCIDVSGIQKYLKNMELNRVQQRAVLRVGLELLYSHLCNGVPVRWDEAKKYLVKAPLPVGSREMMIFIHYLPTVLNHAFPGYSRKGALFMIARNKGNGNVRDKRDRRPEVFRRTKEGR